MSILPYALLPLKLGAAHHPTHTPTLPHSAPMPPSTDYIRHAARLTRQIQLATAMGDAPKLDSDYFKALAKALDEIAEAVEKIRTTVD